MRYGQERRDRARGRARIQHQHGRACVRSMFFTSSAESSSLIWPPVQSMVSTRKSSPSLTLPTCQRRDFLVTTLDIVANMDGDSFTGRLEPVLFSLGYNCIPGALLLWAQ